MNPPDDNIQELPELDVYRDGKEWYVCVLGKPVRLGFDNLETADLVIRWLEYGGWRALNTARREE